MPACTLYTSKSTILRSLNTRTVVTHVICARICFTQGLFGVTLGPSSARAMSLCKPARAARVVSITPTSKRVTFTLPSSLPGALQLLDDRLKSLSRKRPSFYTMKLKHLIDHFTSSPHQPLSDTLRGILGSCRDDDKATNAIFSSTGQSAPELNPTGFVVGSPVLDKLVAEQEVC